MSRAEYVGKGTIQGCPVRLGYVFSVGGPKLLEGQRSILAPAEGKPPMVVVAVQGAPGSGSISVRAPRSVF